MINLYCIRPKGLNIGNDVIFQSMKHFLYKHFGYDINLIVIPATARYETEADAGLTPKTIYTINQHADGVIIGGGNLYENNELDINIDALGKLDVPMMLFSLSRGRIYNKFGEMVERTDSMPDKTLIALNSKTKHSYARDQSTMAYLHKIGCSDVKLSACPSLFINRITDFLPTLPNKYNERVLISIRNPALMSIPPQKQIQIYHDIKLMLTFFKSKGLNDIYLMCHDQRDISYASSFKDVQYIYTNDLFTYLAMLKSCKLHVTYRLHSFLPCLSWDVPVIKISYDERALSLIETIGYNDWNINIFSENNVVEALEDRYNRLADLTRIKATNEQLWYEINNKINNAFSNFYAEVTQRMN